MNIKDIGNHQLEKGQMKPRRGHHLRRFLEIIIEHVKFGDDRNYQVHLLGFIDNVCFKTYNSGILMVFMRVF